MNAIKFWIVIVTLTSCMSSNKLSPPLKNGVLVEHKIRTGLHLTNDFLFESKVDSVVLAVEESTVQSVFKVDGTYTVVMSGKHKVGYSNLIKVFVNKGEKASNQKAIGLLALEGDKFATELNIEGANRKSSKDIFVN